MVVRARYSDGTHGYVTSLAVFYSNNDSAAPVSPAGLVTAGRRHVRQHGIDQRDRRGVVLLRVRVRALAPDLQAEKNRMIDTGSMQLP